MADNHIRLKIPDAPGELEIGDYVFATRWSDADWNGPWAVGYVYVIGKDHIGLRHEDGSLIPGVGLRGFKYAVPVSGEQGSLIAAEYKHREGDEFSVDVIARILDKVWRESLRANRRINDERPSARSGKN